MPTEWGVRDEPTAKQQVDRMIYLEKHVLTCPFVKWTAARTSLRAVEVADKHGSRSRGSAEGGSFDGPAGRGRGRFPFSGGARGSPLRYGRDRVGEGRRDRSPDGDRDRDRGRGIDQSRKSWRDRSRSRSRERVRSQERDRPEKYKHSGRGDGKSEADRKGSAVPKSDGKQQPRQEERKRTAEVGRDDPPKRAMNEDRSSRKGTQWCKFFFTGSGVCKDGDRCTFSHDWKDCPTIVKKP